jgi:hypothetical protein
MVTYVGVGEFKFREKLRQEKYREKRGIGLACSSATGMTEIDET